MNWGNRIILVYIGFIAIIVTLVTISMKQKVELVSTDYYAKELAYESDITKKMNAATAKELPSIRVIDNSMIIQYPDTFIKMGVEGSIHIYKPSDSGSDKTFPIKLENGIQMLDASPFSSGMYKVKLDWSSNNVPYMLESIVNLN